MYPHQQDSKFFNAKSKKTVCAWNILPNSSKDCGNGNEIVIRVFGGMIKVQDYTFPTENQINGASSEWVKVKSKEPPHEMIA